MSRSQTLTTLAGLLISLMPAAAFGQGRVAFEGKIPSNVFGGERMIRVYVSASYAGDGERRFPVMYVHDGQNAFRTAGPHAAFGSGSWQLDKTVDELTAAGKMHETILVAIDCSAERYLEYRGPARNYSDEELQRAKLPPWSPGDKNGAYPISDPQKPENFAATVYHALGIPESTTWPAATGRPYHVHEAKPIERLFV